jgi:hypothetical protein
MVRYTKVGKRYSFSSLDGKLTIASALEGMILKIIKEIRLNDTKKSSTNQ